MRHATIIELDKCIDGNLYKLASRNLSYGVFSKKENGFIGIRQKFTLRFLDTEYHWDTGAPFGTASPLEDLGRYDEATGVVETGNKNLMAWLETVQLSRSSKTDGE